MTRARLALALWPLTASRAIAQVPGSLRLHGNGVDNINRVKIQVHDPANPTQDPPANVGATDFTLEFWMQASADQNPPGPVQCGPNRNRKFGNIVLRG